MVIRIMLNPKSVNMEGVTTLAQAQAANEQLKQGIEERNKQAIEAWEARTGLKYDPEWREHIVRPDGPFREVDGSIVREGTLRNGEWDGEVREYNGDRLTRSVVYKNGVQTGSSKEYRFDGTLAVERVPGEDGQSVTEIHYGASGKTEDYRLVRGKRGVVLFDSRNQPQEQKPETATEEQPSTAMDAQEALNRAGERFRNRRAAEALAQDTALPETGAEGESDLDGLAGNTALSVGERMEEASFAEVRPADVGRQRRAGAYYPDIGQWLANTAFSIGERRKAEYRAVITSKRPDLPSADVDAFMGELDKLGDAKREKTALHWFVKGGLQLPEDGEKFASALKVAPKFKLDPFAFASPDELLAEADRRNPKKQKLAYIDPDTVPELTNKRDLGHGVVVYDVEDSPRGQAAMRRIMNSHLGRGAGGRWRGPWCLLTATDAGEVSASAKRYWMEYSTSGRGVAFYNGIICAFQSSKIRKTEWWDMFDVSHGSLVPYIRLAHANEIGQRELPVGAVVHVPYEINPETGETLQRGAEIATLGNNKNGVWMKWELSGPRVRLAEFAVYQNGKIAPSTQTYERVLNSNDFERALYDEQGKESVRARYTNGVTTFITFSHQDGTLERISIAKYSRNLPMSIGTERFNERGNGSALQNKGSISEIWGLQSGISDKHYSKNAHVILTLHGSKPKEILGRVNVYRDGRVESDKLPVSSIQELESFCREKNVTLTHRVVERLKAYQRGDIEALRVKDPFEGVPLPDVSTFEQSPVPGNVALSVGSRPGRAPVVEPGGDVREAGEGTLAWLRRKFVHSQTPVFDAVRRVMGVGREPPDALNVEAAAKNVHGKIRARQEMLQRAYLEPLKAILAQPGMDRKRFDDYALALHALERNRMIQERSVVVDPTTGEVVDLGVEAGSGVTNAWAERVIREIQRDPFAAQYKEAANILAEMNRFVLRGAVADGLLTEAQAATWMRLSPHYVPLKSGGAAPGAIHKRATGRFTRPDSVLVNSMRQAYATVRNGELNRVNKTMADWIREYDPNGEQVGGTVPESHKHAKIKMAEPQYVPKGSSAEALLRERGIRLVETEDKGGYWVDTGVLPNALKRVVRESVPQGDDIVTFWENGERKFIRFEGKRGRDGTAENEAARIADALNFKNVLHKEGRFWDAIRGLTRWKANVSTSWNPTFIVRNMGADVFNTANLMMIEGKYAELARTMRNYPEALRTIARLHSLRREAGDSKMERMFARCFCAVFCW